MSSVSDHNQVRGGIPSEPAKVIPLRSECAYEKNQELPTKYTFPTGPSGPSRDTRKIFAAIFVILLLAIALAKSLNLSVEVNLTIVNNHPAAAATPEIPKPFETTSQTGTLGRTPSLPSDFQPN